MSKQRHGSSSANVAATARMLGISEIEVVAAYRDLFHGSGELYHRTVGDRLVRICGRGSGKAAS